MTVKEFVDVVNNTVIDYAKIYEMRWNENYNDYDCKFTDKRVKSKKDLEPYYDCELVSFELEMMYGEYDDSAIYIKMPRETPMQWDYDKRGNYWCASRKMPDGICQFVYTIYPDDRGGYVAYANNTAYGAERVAVKNYTCTKASVFKDLEKLMADIENGNTLWLYTGFCNCVGTITKEEY